MAYFFYFSLLQCLPVFLLWFCLVFFLSEAHTESKNNGSQVLHTQSNWLHVFIHQTGKRLCVTIAKYIKLSDTLLRDSKKRSCYTCFTALTLWACRPSSWSMGSPPGGKGKQQQQCVKSVSCSAGLFWCHSPMSHQVDDERLFLSLTYFVQHWGSCRRRLW